MKISQMSCNVFNLMQQLLCVELQWKRCQNYVDALSFQFSSSNNIIFWKLNKPVEILTHTDFPNGSEWRKPRWK